MTASTAIPRIIGAGGALLFGFFFVLTFWRPLWLEKFAADFIRSELTSEIHTRIDSLAFDGASGAVSGLASAIYQENRQRIDRYEAEIEQGLDRKIAACIAQLSKLDAAARERLGHWLESGRLDRIASLAAMNAKLDDLIQGKYLRMVGELERDLRIFTAINGLCFLLLLLATFVRPEAAKLLFAPAVLLVTAVLACSYAYLFRQNWLLTVIYSDYVGFAYFGYLALAFAFLCDILLNRGRVTARLAEAAIGGIAGALPG